MPMEYSTGTFYETEMEYSTGTFYETEMEYSIGTFYETEMAGFEPACPGGLTHFECAPL